MGEQNKGHLSRRSFLKLAATAAGAIAGKRIFDALNLDSPVSPPNNPHVILPVAQQPDVQNKDQQGHQEGFNEQQKHEYDDIQDLYRKNGLNYPLSMQNLSDNVLQKGEKRYDNAYVSVQMTPEDADKYGLIVLQIGHLLFGDKSTQYLFELRKGDEGGAGYVGGTSSGPKVSTMFYGLNARDFGPNTRATVALHEFTHLIDGKPGLFTLDEKLTLEKLKATILFRFGTIGILEVYNNWYTNLSYVPLGQHNSYYWKIGDYLSQDGASTLADGLESNDLIRQWIHDLGGLQNDTQKQLLGAKIMRQKALHPEWQLSENIQTLYSANMYGVMIEVFAEAISNVVTKFETRFATERDLEPVVEEFLTVARYGLDSGQHVKTVDLRRELSMLTPNSPTIPYEIHPPT